MNFWWCNDCFERGTLADTKLGILSHCIPVRVGSSRRRKLEATLWDEKGLPVLFQAGVAL